MGDFNLSYRPRTHRSKANSASPSLGRGRALMPAPPFPTNLLLRKIFAGTLSHSKNNKPLVRGKLCPAAEGNPPRGSIFGKIPYSSLLYGGEQVLSCLFVQSWF